MKSEIFSFSLFLFLVIGDEPMRELWRSRSWLSLSLSLFLTLSLFRGNELR